MVERSSAFVIKKYMYDLTEQFIPLGTAEVTFNGNGIPSVPLKIKCLFCLIYYKLNMILKQFSYICLYDLIFPC
jgi:hypothetical protein